KSLLAAVKDATALLSNPQYFLETDPDKYSSDDYFVSLRGMTVQDESMEKRLQTEWRCKLIPKLKESKNDFLRETGARLEKTWRLEKRSRKDSLEEAKDENATKKYKTGMRHAYQAHQLKVLVLDVLYVSGRLAILWSEFSVIADTITTSISSNLTAAFSSVIVSCTIIASKFDINHGSVTCTRAKFIGNDYPKDEVFRSLQNGKQLPDWVWKQPDYDFILQLGSLDLGDRITSLYNGVRKQTGLDHTKVGQIAADTAILHSAVLDSFYSRELAMADLDRARNSEDIWSTRLYFSEKSDAMREGREPRPIDTAPVMDEIMATFQKCKDMDIMPIFYTAMNVFRKFKDWSGKLSETEWMTRIIVPFLEEFMAIQHDVTFACSSLAIHELKTTTPIALGSQFSRKTPLINWIESLPALLRYYPFRPLVQM
ncbi:hypothetical protein BGZ90_006576, partial [Linnemannia elongata]